MLLAAVRLLDAAQLEELLESGRCGVDAADSEGKTALNAVCRSGYMSNVAAMSTAEGDSERRAVKIMACAELLLKHGASPNQRDHYGASPISGARSLFPKQASEGAANELEALLLEHGAEQHPASEGTIQLAVAKRTLRELGRCSALCGQGRAEAAGLEGQRLLEVGKLPESLMVNVLALACTPEGGSRGFRDRRADDLARLLRVNDRRRMWEAAPSGARWSYLEYSSPEVAEGAPVVVMFHSSFFDAELYQGVAPWLVSKLGVRVQCFDLLGGLVVEPHVERTMSTARTFLRPITHSSHVRTVRVSGNGQSSSAKGHSIETMSDDLADFLQGEEKVHICGVSVGCDIAIHLAAKLVPSQVASATLACFASRDKPPPEVKCYMQGFMEGLRAEVKTHREPHLIPPRTCVDPFACSSIGLGYVGGLHAVPRDARESFPLGRRFPRRQREAP
jgi:hypothetical protein